MILTGSKAVICVLSEKSPPANIYINSGTRIPREAELKDEASRESIKKQCFVIRLASTCKLPLIVLRSVLIA